MRAANLRWKRWVAIAAALVAAYAASGFWLVPVVIRHQVGRLGESWMARQATVGDVRFNPFTLRLEAADLRLAEADGAPLFAVGNLAVQLQWRSLVRRAWSFAEIRVTAPSARLVVTPQGKFNLAELLATLERRPQQVSSDTILPRVVIERFTLEQGRVELQDRRGGYANVFSPIDVALTDFSTLAGQGDAYTASARSADGGQLRWKGHASANPIRASGEFTLENASLPALGVYLKPFTRATVATGQLSATLPYRISYGDEGFVATLAGIKVSLRDLAVARDGGSTPLLLAAREGQMQLKLTIEQAGAGFNLRVADAAVALSDLALTRGTQAPFKLAQLGLTGGAFDLGSRHASVGRLFAEGGQVQLTRDRKGQFGLAGMLFEASGADPPVAPWTAAASSVELSKFGAEVEDQGSGVKVHVEDFAATLTGASSDLTRPVKFDAGLNLHEGGQLSAQGSVVPATGAVVADVRLRQLMLAPLQPLLSRYLKLKIAGGDLSGQGRLEAAAAGTKGATLRYVGAFNLAGLALKESDGGLFASWKNVSSEKLTASLGPNLLDIPQLRVVGADAKLIIENDRSFNAARLLVRQRTGTRAAAAAPAVAADPFPVRIRQVRLQNAKLDFTDLSLRPQFAARIYALNGSISGLSSRRDARSRVELDGRVDQFGLARIRGELNPFAPSNNTDLNVVFKNVDMVPASPYTAKFAGYKIAEGKISLDLQYTVRNGQLEGANQIEIDKLTLGERVDSPDALKLPLELAIAILKDSNGRIDLGLPISGNINDPQFSYSAVIWKALGTVLTRIVTAPFRALGALLGVSGEKLEAVDFDAGSDKLLPPEREKVEQVAQLLAKRTQLKLSVPAQYSEAADAAALRSRAVRVEIARRAGIKLGPGEDAGPVDPADPSTRIALRDMYVERFGAAELDQQKEATQGAATDATFFYNKLLERLDKEQPLDADALTQLGARRAGAILAALREAGVDPARAAAGAPEKVGADSGKPVSLKLQLATQ